MTKLRSLFKNISVLGIGNLATKFAQYILVVLCTYKLTTAEYGFADIIIQSTNMLVPLITLDISSAVFRFSMDRCESKPKVFTNALFVDFCATFFICFIGFFIIRFSYGELKLISILIVVLVVSQLFQVSVKEFIRGTGLLHDYVLGGICNALVQITVCYILVWKCECKLVGYVLALFCGNFVELIFYILKSKLLKNIHVYYISTQEIRKLIKYSLPLTPNTLMWWIVSASDRFFILFLVGASATGQYAVSSKLPAIISLISTLFFQAWQISALENTNDDNRDIFYSSVFNALWLFMAIVVASLFIFIKPLIKLVVASDYWGSWVYVPFLAIGAALNAVQSFLGVNYTVAKDTVGALKSTVFMAILNIVLNYVLVLVLGVYGVTLATLISYIFVSIYRYYDTRKYIKVHVKFHKMIITYVILFFTGFIMVVTEKTLFISMFSFILIICLNNRELKCAFRSMLLHLKRI